MASAGKTERFQIAMENKLLKKGHLLLVEAAGVGLEGGVDST
jgi:hypothetical protein